MAAEVLRLSDVIVPEVYSNYLIEQSVKKTGLYRSGILASDARINDFVAGGGTTFNIPFFQRLSGEPQAIQSNQTLETKKTTTSRMTARRLLFAKAWSAEELASALSGASAMDAITSMVDDYWAWNFQRILFANIKGVIADNMVNDSGDLVNDITTTGTVGTSHKISSSAVINTIAKLGDATEDITAIAMHSTPYFVLVAANLITFEPTSAQDLGFGTYLGKTVIVTDELTADTDGSNRVYWTILFKRGAFLYGESGNGITTVETDRTVLKGEDILVTRRQFCMHPVGFRWLETSVTGDNPTRDELEEGGNWDRVYDKKNCGFVILRSNG